MKKIIALMLVIGCMLAFASCGWFGDDEEEDTTPDYTEDIAKFQASIDASCPDVAEIDVVLASILGDLNGSYTVTYNEDGTATVDYSYEKFNSFEAGAVFDEAKSTYTGTVTVDADGAISGGEFVEAVAFDINLDASKLSSISIVSGTLRATVKAADTAAVLGVAIGADVDLIISTGADGITSITISYTTSAGDVEISTGYTYFEEVVEEEETEDETEGEETEGETEE